MQASNVSFANHVERAGFSTWVEKQLLTLMFRTIGPAPVGLAVGKRNSVIPPGVVPKFTVKFHDLRTVAEVLIDPETAFGDGWTKGRIQVVGDLTAFLEALYASLGEVNNGVGMWSRLRSQWTDRLQANTLEGSRDNIHAHYDLGNQFYRLWLDSQMVYTCAYFSSPSVPLEDAQVAKMNYVCRKLRLQPGETVLEAGCGWGALAMHMAQNYGVRVKAFNISREQISYARQRASELNLGDRAEFIEDDYRNVTGTFDAFVSLGMLEHVSREDYRQLGGVIHRSIGDRGRGLLHFIGRSAQFPFSRWIRKRIFPGAHAPSLREALEVLEPFDYFVQDIEDLRIHYARTVEHWLHRFEKSSEQISTLYGSEFERAWRLYLAGSIAGFRTGTLQLFQIVFAGAKFKPAPWTRAHLYCSSQKNTTCTPTTF